jgi:hypothetical protein
LPAATFPSAGAACGVVATLAVAALVVAAAFELRRTAFAGALAARTLAALSRAASLVFITGAAIRGTAVFATRARTTLILTATAMHRRAAPHVTTRLHVFVAAFPVAADPPTAFTVTTGLAALRTTERRLILMRTANRCGVRVITANDHS